MRTLFITLAVLFLVPTLRAQQADIKENPPQVAPQASPNSNGESSLPPELRPGHPLDPADVDILTGKRDREVDASRREKSSAAMGYYAYSSEYELKGRGAGSFNPPLLPLRRSGNPFFFFNMPPGGFGRRGVRGSRR